MSILVETAADGRRRSGRLKKSLRETFREDIQARGVSWSEVPTVPSGETCPLCRKRQQDLSKSYLHK